MKSSSTKLVQIIIFTLVLNSLSGLTIAAPIKPKCLSKLPVLAGALTTVEGSKFFDWTGQVIEE